MVFGSKKEYEQYRPNEFAIAYYTQIAGRDYIVLSGVSDDVFPVAVHEYVHLVVQHSGLILPPWLNEGLSEMYSTLKPEGDKILIGSLIPGRMYELSQHQWVPLTVILSAGRDSPYYSEKNKAGSLYNEGWALTHMLQLQPRIQPGFCSAAAANHQGQASEDSSGKRVQQAAQHYRKRASVLSQPQHFQRARGSGKATGRTGGNGGAGAGVRRETYSARSE